MGARLLAILELEHELVRQGLGVGVALDLGGIAQAGAELGDELGEVRGLGRSEGDHLLAQDRGAALRGRARGDRLEVVLDLRRNCVSALELLGLGVFSDLVQVALPLRSHLLGDLRRLGQGVLLAGVHITCHAHRRDWEGVHRNQVLEELETLGRRVRKEVRHAGGAGRVEGSVVVRLRRGELVDPGVGGIAQRLAALEGSGQVRGGEHSGHAVRLTVLAIHQGHAQARLLEERAGGLAGADVETDRGETRPAEDPAGARKVRIDDEEAHRPRGVGAGDGGAARGSRRVGGDARKRE